MRRILGFALLAGAGALAAAAYASSDSVRFRATLTGTFAEEWTYADPVVADGPCTLQDKGSGVRRITFRGSRIVEVDHSRVAPFVVLVRGKRERGGSVTTERKCALGDGGFAQIADCILTRGAYANGSLRITSPAPHKLSLGALRLPADRRAILDCPRPSGRPAPTLGAAKLPARDLVKLETMSVRSKFDRPESQPQGDVVWRVRWTITFKRLGA